MKELPQNVSESTRKRNPHLYGPMMEADELPITQEGKTLEEMAKIMIESHSSYQKPKPMPITQYKTSKRIRQSTKPLMNKLEQRLFDKLCEEHKPIYPQAITFKLANGVRYTPDIFCFDWTWKLESRSVAWEVKGPWMTDDAVVKLKVFAAAYPSIVVLLSSEDKDTGFWTFQEVYP